MLKRPMIAAIAFDTHRFVKRLAESGLFEAQEEVFVDERINMLNSNLLTKHGLLTLFVLLKENLNRRCSLSSWRANLSSLIS